MHGTSTLAAGTGNSIGVEGTGNDYGVSGTSTHGYGVYGSSTVNAGVYGTSSSDGSPGVYGNIPTSGLPDSAGVSGNNSDGFGVVGGSNNGIAVAGQSTNHAGVYGVSSNSVGVYAVSNGFGNVSPSAGLYAVGSSAVPAGIFAGNVQVNGTLSKGGGSFLIDHPLDPANKSLYHSFVESPDMKNMYDGVTTLDAKGEAIVILPNWFGALNADFRYQLTCIGGYAPVYIAREIANNQFTIAGGHAGMKVSWMVTGIR